MKTSLALHCCLHANGSSVHSLEEYYLDVHLFPGGGSETGIREEIPYHADTT